MKTKVLATVVCILTIANFVSADAVYFDDGQIHSINNSIYQDDIIWLDKNTYNEPGTHFELLSGGKVGLIMPYNKSTVTINGGSLGSLNVAIDTHGDNIITINSGSISGDVAANNNSRIYMNGGSLVGSFSDIIVYGTGICEIKGGSIEGALAAGEAGFIYLYGSNFSVNGQSLHYGDKLRDYGFFVEENGMITGTVTGTLLNGSEMNNNYWISPTTEGDIIIIPEPVTLLLLALGGLVLRKKR
jgi:hypothetical protein